MVLVQQSCSMLPAILCGPSVGLALEPSSAAVASLGRVGSACSPHDGSGSRSVRSDGDPPNRTNKTGNHSRSLWQPKVSNLALGIFFWIWEIRKHTFASHNVASVLDLLHLDVTSRTKLRGSLQQIQTCLLLVKLPLLPQSCLFSLSLFFLLPELFAAKTSMPGYPARDTVLEPTCLTCRDGVVISVFVDLPARTVCGHARVEVFNPAECGTQRASVVSGLLVSYTATPSAKNNHFTALVSCPCKRSALAPRKASLDIGGKLFGRGVSLRLGNRGVPSSRHDEHHWCGHVSTSENHEEKG